MSLNLGDLFVDDCLLYDGAVWSMASWKSTSDFGLFDNGTPLFSFSNTGVTFFSLEQRKANKLTGLKEVKDMITERVADYLQARNICPAEKVKITDKSALEGELKTYLMGLSHLGTVSTAELVQDLTSSFINFIKDDYDKESYYDIPIIHARDAIDSVLGRNVIPTAHALFLRNRVYVIDKSSMQTEPAKGLSIGYKNKSNYYPVFSNQLINSFLKFYEEEILANLDIFLKNNLKQDQQRELKDMIENSVNIFVSASSNTSLLGLPKTLERDWTDDTGEFGYYAFDEGYVLWKRVSKVPYCWELDEDLVKEHISEENQKRIKKYFTFPANIRVGYYFGKNRHSQQAFVVDDYLVGRGKHPYIKSYLYDDCGKPSICMPAACMDEFSKPTPKDYVTQGVAYLLGNGGKGRSKTGNLNFGADCCIGHLNVDWLDERPKGLEVLYPLDNMYRHLHMHNPAEQVCNDEYIKTLDV